MSDPIDARAFREMVRELASEEPHPVDWERTEDALFARLDAELLEGGLLEGGLLAGGPVDGGRFDSDESGTEASFMARMSLENEDGERISEVGLGIADSSDDGFEDGDALEAAADRVSSPYVAARLATLDAIEGPRAIHHIPSIGKLSIVDRADASSSAGIVPSKTASSKDGGEKFSGVRRWSTVLAFVAVAASFAFVLGGLVTGGLAPKNLTTASTNNVAEITAERWVDPSDVPMAPGMSGAHDLSALRSGDMVEATSDAVSFAESDKVSWTISPGSRVLVRAGVDSQSHILVLESGSIHADVVASSGQGVVDPFVVEAGDTRVSVRNTIFSVTRSSKGIVVDVERGFVVVGPRNEVGVGSGRTLHESERGAFSLDGGLTFKPLSPERTAMLTPPNATTDNGTTDGSKREATDPTENSQNQALPTLGAQSDARKKEAAQPTQVGATAPVVPSDPVLTEASIKASLDRCFAQVEAQKRDGSKDDGVSLTMRSTLSLRVADDGAIKGAAFNPPLRSDLQSCAVSLLSAHVDRGARTLEIPVEIRH